MHFARKITLNKQVMILVNVPAAVSLALELFQSIVHSPCQRSIFRTEWLCRGKLPKQ